MPTVKAPERRSKRIVVLSNQRVNVISTPKRHSSNHQVEPTKQPRATANANVKSKTTRLRAKRQSREEELADAYVSLCDFLPRLESQLASPTESSTVESRDLFRQATKLVRAIRDLTDWCISTKKDMGWTPRCVGDNNSLDHQFLSRLYICGSIYERIDNAIITLSDLSPDLSDESFVSQALTDPEDGQDQNEDNDGKGLRDLIELLEEKSGVGKRIRSLLPSCPQLPTGPRCYGLKK